MPPPKERKVWEKEESKKTTETSDTSLWDVCWTPGDGRDVPSTQICHDMSNTALSRKVQGYPRQLNNSILIRKTSSTVQQRQWPITSCLNANNVVNVSSHMLELPCWEAVAWKTPRGYYIRPPVEKAGSLSQRSALVTAKKTPILSVYQLRRWPYLSYAAKTTSSIHFLRLMNKIQAIPWKEARSGASPSSTCVWYHSCRSNQITFYYGLGVWKQYKEWWESKTHGQVHTS